jgi:hypothetical protein
VAESKNHSGLKSKKTPDGQDVPLYRRGLAEQARNRFLQEQENVSCPLHPDLLTDSSHSPLRALHKLWRYIKEITGFTVLLPKADLFTVQSPFASERFSSGFD